MRKIFPIIIFFSTIFAQTTVNPDISVIGDLIVETDGEQSNFNSSGIELAIQGYVNPFARADVYLHKHNDESPIHLEEAFLSIERGLPLNLGMRIGKMRPDFSKINNEHMHTYYYILTSETVQSILGEEMWSSIGIEGNMLLPFPWYSNISIGVFQSGISQHHHDHEEIAEMEHDHDDEGNAEKVISARLSHFVDISHITHLEFGTSFYHELEQSEESIIGADFKFKWRPDTYRSFVVQSDYFHKLVHDDEIIKTGYAWLNYQFKRIWNTGFIFDYSNDIEEESYKSIGVFVGFSPVEESSVFRLRVHQAYHGNEDPNLTFVAQVIWSLGPHKPHQF